MMVEIDALLERVRRLDGALNVSGQVDAVTDGIERELDVALQA